jgi:hypothetical protein
VPPFSQGSWDPSNTLTLAGTDTDTSSIVSTANVVDQKSGATNDVPPDQPVAATVVTAVNGTVTAAGTNSTASRRSFLAPSQGFSKRDPGDYTLVFPGTGTDPSDRDAAIQGTAYLTYTLVPNATYDVTDCLANCDAVETCGK